MNAEDLNEKFSKAAEAMASANASIGDWADEAGRRRELEAADLEYRRSATVNAEAATANHAAHTEFLKLETDRVERHRTALERIWEEGFQKIADAIAGRGR